ncbi:MAG: toprim domain-containing protein [Pseudomonadota bacterium]
MNQALRADIVARLIGEYDFVERGSYLQKGRCPSCHKRSAFVSSEAPWMIKCGRENNCGHQYHAKELFADLFNSWSERFGSTEHKSKSPTPVADAYLQYGRGFDIGPLKGCYTQENYYNHQIGQGSATVRFTLSNGAWWERIIDKPERFGQRKANFSPGKTYTGLWWQLPNVSFVGAKEVWITEGVFNTIALEQNGIHSASAMSCVNYPAKALEQLRSECTKAGEPLPRIIWAFDNGQAGLKYIRKFVSRARREGWLSGAALVPRRGRDELDWNDAHQAGRLTGKDVDYSRYLGELAITKRAGDKAVLMYQRNEKTEFPFEHRNRLYYWKLDTTKYQKELARISADEDHGDKSEEEIREAALMAAGCIQPIADCYPQALYSMSNEVTDEAWFYFRVQFPDGASDVKGTFTAGQIASAPEFKKRLLHISQRSLWTGSGGQLDAYLTDQFRSIRRVSTVDFVGYSKQHKAWVFDQIAMSGGKVYRHNDEDFFEIGSLAIKTLSQSVPLSINSKPGKGRPEWADALLGAFRQEGIIALAYWLGTLFAEQIREQHKSYPFLEIVGEAGSGKSTLIEFLWKLLGRSDYEGFDPSKATLPARSRNFAQVSNLPVVLIESDRDQEGAKQRQFDWDELKTAYNGRSVRARGVKNGGNDTYEPPFRGAIVISQNAAVNASEAIIQRIVHLTFTRAEQTAQTRSHAEFLERFPTEEASEFLTRAVTHEDKIMELFRNNFSRYAEALEEMPEIRVNRIAKNHAQLLCLVDALGPKGLGLFEPGEIEPARHFIAPMAIERQKSISADHPVVQDFWEVYDYIEGLHDKTTLNHYGDSDELIAINLRQFEAWAADLKLRIPYMADLKRHLRASRSRKFVDANRSVRSKLGKSLESTKTVKCWVFEK